MAKPAEFTLAYQDTTEYRTTSGEEGECLITFSLTGDQIAGALDAGRWEIKEALDDQGTRLNPPESYTRNFTPLMRRSSAQDSEAVLKLGLSVPPRTANHIRSLKGSLGINVYRQQIVIIEDLEKNRNQLIENPLFQVHGFTVQLIDPQHAYPGYTSESEKRVLYSRAVAVRIEGNINKVNSFRLVDPGGNELASRPAGFAAGRSRIMGRMADQPLPAKTTLHLQIPIDPKEVRIPFSFTDIPLP
ncbi:MAG: hypothetical protein AAGH72_10195 [Verrucomicrobiota bacterium]